MGDDMGHGIVLPGSNEAATRARTAPSVRSTADNTRLHGKLSYDDLSSSSERAPAVTEGTPGLRGDACRDGPGVHIPNVTGDGGIDPKGGGAKNGDGRQEQHARRASAERGETQSGRREEGAGTDRVIPLHTDEAMVGADPISEATGDTTPNHKISTNAFAHTKSPMEAEEVQRLSEAYSEATQEYLNAVGSGEEDEEGNRILPEIDDRFLTVGQRLRRLRDARDNLQREKHRAHMKYR
ncbi:hypothetical protein Esi_0039_0101 [Ectocarpus siliculosus]|uniref:Uncharacterized protein n=1 Tax=Ectocarpus siliculosus TaxID=2880 RepID=D7FZZ8_ECTSI|nr:hypothetical protein Esi_0039_0101 [Ectocarpus siliculosus]|eukprot:CBJ48623.1 hypothetical protein Esi_0039_0101 [Ectocarpus siliculosus]